MQKLVKRSRFDAQKGGFFVDEFLRHHIDCNFYGCGGCALAGACLEHPEFFILDGEFNVLHVFVVAFQLGINIDQVAISIGHIFFQRWVFRRPFLFADLIVSRPAPGAFPGYLLWCADTGDNVLTLGVDQIFTVKEVFARGRIAREGHSRGAALAHIAENHGLHVDGCAPVIVKTVHFTVQDGTGGIP